jgi:hypothetical protein
MLRGRGGVAVEFVVCVLHYQAGFTASCDVCFLDFVSFRSPSLFYLLIAGVEVVLFSRDHTQTDTRVGRTPLDEGSARRRDLYLTTQTLYKTKIHAPGGIRTHNPTKRSAADPRLRPRRLSNGQMTDLR